MLVQQANAAWVEGKGTGDVSYFEYQDKEFKTKFTDAPEIGAALQELVRELAEWRLAEYLDRAQRGLAPYTTLKVTHSGGTPILFLPTGAERSDLPSGWTPITIDGGSYEANFVKIAVNVVRKPGDDANQLPGILRGWFGPDAGAPGTRHEVQLQRKGEAWHLSALGRLQGELKLWQS